jgi:O-antigen/teichoic acid export membrane protein
MRHFLVYGSGHVLLRVGSILLLPFYTRLLEPWEYGIIGLVDLVTGLFGVLLGGQVAAAATRQHYSKQWGAHEDQVWWNAHWLLVALASIVILPGVFAANQISALMLGSGVESGGLYIVLGLLTLLLGPLEELGMANLRAHKRSAATSIFGLVRLLLNASINLTLLWWWQLGVLGVLLGNLLTGLIAAIASLSITIWRLKPRGPDRQLIAKLWSFSGPMFLTGGMALVMHQSGRVFLRAYSDLGEVGIFGLAQQIGQGIGGLLLAPFAMIFVPLAFQLGSRPESEEFLREAFRIHIGAITLIMFAVSALAPEIFGLLLGPTFASAVAVTPLVCLAYLLFSLHSHFSIPVQVAERTALLVPTAILATLICLLGNWLLVPRLGLIGASIVLVLTFFTYSFGGLALYRRVRVVSYPLTQFSTRLLCIIATYLLVQAWRSSVPPGLAFVLPLLSVIAWFYFLARTDEWIRRASFLTVR